MPFDEALHVSYDPMQLVHLCIVAVVPTSVMKAGALLAAPASVVVVVARIVVVTCDLNTLLVRDNVAIIAQKHLTSRIAQLAFRVPIGVMPNAPRYPLKLFR